jgi:hypothetical protein
MRHSNRGREALDMGRCPLLLLVAAPAIKELARQGLEMRINLLQSSLGDAHKLEVVRRWAIAREDGPRAGELKTGPKTQKLEVQQKLGPRNPNWLMASPVQRYVLGAFLGSGSSERQKRFKKRFY